MLDDDDKILHLGTDPDYCPIENLVEVAKALASLVEVLEDVNDGDHRHRYLSLSLTHLQEAENWLHRWLGENLSEEDEEMLEP